MAKMFFKPPLYFLVGHNLILSNATGDESSENRKTHLITDDDIFKHKITKRSSSLTSVLGTISSSTISLYNSNTHQSNFCLMFKSQIESFTFNLQFLVVALRSTTNSVVVYHLKKN